jgi:hypothetical protein
VAFSKKRKKFLSKPTAIIDEAGWILYTGRTTLVQFSCGGSTPGIVARKKMENEEPLRRK